MAIFEYDGNADALYYRLTGKPVKGTKCIGDRVNVDYDEDGEAVGIEVLSPPGFSVSVSTPGPVCVPEHAEHCDRRTEHQVPRECLHIHPAADGPVT